ncbi:hypothetical protein ACVJBD_004400 [Rhizobium mongolense]
MLAPIMPSLARSIQPATIGARFETVGEIADGVIVRGDRAKSVEGRWIGDRRGAQDTCVKIVRERQTQHFAVRPLDEVHAGPAFRTQSAVASSNNAAGGAGRRIEPIGEHGEGRKNCVNRSAPVVRN